MRIVAGVHRGRALQAPTGKAVRPTADRTRQALFNLLEHGRIAADGARVAGARVLDVFAGTGALGLEALSRGAASLTAMERDAAALALIRANVAMLGETERTTLLQADALAPPQAPAPAGLIFLDPPYGEDLAAPALLALEAQGWIAEGAIVAVETGSKDPFEPPPGFTALDARRYGRAIIWLIEKR